MVVLTYGLALYIPGSSYGGSGIDPTPRIRGWKEMGQVVNAPLSGAPLFNLSLKADVPAEASITKIKADISRLADDMNLDLNFSK